MKAALPFDATLATGGSVLIPTLNAGACFLHLYVLAGGTTYTVQVEGHPSIIGGFFAVANGIVLAAGGSQYFNFSRNISGQQLAPAGGAFATFFPLGTGVLITNSGANALFVGGVLWQEY